VKVFWSECWMLVAILGRYSAYKFGPDRGSCPESVGFSQDNDIVQAPSPLFLSRTPWIEVQAGDRGVQFYLYQSK
jgi:hypothetical protein